MAFPAGSGSCDTYRNAAVHALHARPAAPAQHRQRIPASVNQHKRLRLPRETLLYPRMQRRRNRAGPVRFLKILAQIYNLDARQRAILHA